MAEARSQTAAPTQAPRSKQVPTPLRLLAVVDGTERTNRVLDYIVTLARGREAIDIVVLNVQSKREDARLRGYQSFKQDDVDDRLINDLGAPIVDSVSRWLDKAAIQNRSKILIGDPASTILRCAAEEDCDCIVIGDRRPEGIRRWLAATAGLIPGSPSVYRLLAAANTPVVVVK